MRNTEARPAPSLNEQLVIVKDDNTYTTSRKVAEIFGKQHAHVLREIEKLKPHCVGKFTQSIFGLSYYRDKSGKKNKEFYLTKNGFILLTMGFSGQKALEFKIAYMNAFDQMQEIITKRLYGEGVTLTELRKKVTCNYAKDLFFHDEGYVYLRSEVLKYLGYKNINQKARERYINCFVTLNGKVWCNEAFVKMKIRQRAAVNERLAVLQDCERILQKKIERAKGIEQFRKKYNV